jgi:S-DNA-T family DNA segregation ATPase FtsK/SpoIIIE
MNKEGTGRRDEIIGILLLSLAILILTSLLSYTPWDPSHNVAAHAGRALKAENLAGKIGANLSEGLVDVFGICAISSRC